MQTPRYSPSASAMDRPLPWLIAWSIASYRDSELVKTLFSALHQSHFPSRLFPIILWQGDIDAPCCLCRSNQDRITPPAILLTSTPSPPLKEKTQREFLTIHSTLKKTRHSSHHTQPPEKRKTLNGSRHRLPDKNRHEDDHCKESLSNSSHNSRSGGRHPNKEEEERGTCSSLTYSDALGENSRPTELERLNNDQDEKREKKKRSLPSDQRERSRVPGGIDGTPVDSQEEACPLHISSTTTPRQENISLEDSSASSSDAPTTSSPSSSSSPSLSLTPCTRQSLSDHHGGGQSPFILLERIERSQELLSGSREEVHKQPEVEEEEEDHCISCPCWCHERSIARRRRECEIPNHRAAPHDHEGEKENGVLFKEVKSVNSSYYDLERTSYGMPQSPSEPDETNACSRKEGIPSVVSPRNRMICRKNEKRTEGDRAFGKDGDGMSSIRLDEEECCHAREILGCPSKDVSSGGCGVHTGDACRGDDGAGEVSEEDAWRLKSGVNEEAFSLRALKEFFIRRDILIHETHLSHHDHHSSSFSFSCPPPPRPHPPASSSSSATLSASSPAFSSSSSSSSDSSVSPFSPSPSSSSSSPCLSPSLEKRSLNEILPYLPRWVQDQLRPRDANQEESSVALDKAFSPLISSCFLLSLPHPSPSSSLSNHIKTSLNTPSRDPSTSHLSTSPFLPVELSSQDVNYHSHLPSSISPSSSSSPFSPSSLSSISSCPGHLRESTEISRASCPSRDLRLLHIPIIDICSYFRPSFDAPSDLTPSPVRRDKKESDRISQPTTPTRDCSSSSSSLSSVHTPHLHHTGISSCEREKVRHTFDTSNPNSVSLQIARDNEDKKEERLVKQDIHLKKEVEGVKEVFSSLLSSTFSPRRGDEVTTIRIAFMDYRESRGPCFARYLCELLSPFSSLFSSSSSRSSPRQPFPRYLFVTDRREVLEEEEKRKEEEKQEEARKEEEQEDDHDEGAIKLVLQTDSHMRFAPHFDCFLVHQLYLAALLKKNEDLSSSSSKEEKKEKRDERLSSSLHCSSDSSFSSSSSSGGYSSVFSSYLKSGGFSSSSSSPARVNELLHESRVLLTAYPPGYARATPFYGYPKSIVYGDESTPSFFSSSSHCPSMGIEGKQKSQERKDKREVEEEKLRTSVPSQEALLPPVLLCADRFDERNLLRTKGRVLREVHRKSLHRTPLRIERSVSASTEIRRRNDSPSILTDQDEKRRRSTAQTPSIDTLSERSERKKVDQLNGQGSCLRDARDREGLVEERSDKKVQEALGHEKKEERGKKKEHDRIERNRKKEEKEREEGDKIKERKDENVDEEREDDISSLLSSSSSSSSLLFDMTSLFCRCPCVSCSASKCIRDLQEDTPSLWPNQGPHSSPSFEDHSADPSSLSSFSHRLLVCHSFVWPLRSYFWGGGFSFGSSKIHEEVPYDSQLDFVFYGEEQTMTVRFYTHGYTFYAPGASLIFHLWTRKYRPFFRNDLLELETKKVAKEEERPTSRATGSSRVTTRTHLSRRRCTYTPSCLSFPSPTGTAVRGSSSCFFSMLRGEERVFEILALTPGRDEKRGKRRTRRGPFSCCREKIKTRDEEEEEVQGQGDDVMSPSRLTDLSDRQLSRGKTSVSHEEESEEDNGRDDGSIIDLQEERESRERLSSLGLGSVCPSISYWKEVGIDPVSQDISLQAKCGGREYSEEIFRKPAEREEEGMKMLLQHLLSFK